MREQIVFDMEATQYIVWLFSQLDKQYNRDEIENVNFFQLDLESIIETIGSAVLWTLDCYLMKIEEIETNSDRKDIPEILIDFRYKHNGKTALEYLEIFMQSNDMSLDIDHNNPNHIHAGRSKSMSDIFNPIHKNLKEITFLLKNETP